MSDIKAELRSILNPPIAPKETPRSLRTLGDIYSTLEAQRIYNPQQPAVQNPNQNATPKAAPANQQKTGTAASLNTEGAWNKQEK